MASKDDERQPLLDKQRSSIQRGESESLPESADDDSTFRFNCRKLLAFVGPGFLVSIAYLDPGNIEADLQSGTAVEYKLLWVLLWATVLGLLTQRIASRIGVVTGYQMSTLCYEVYPRIPRILLWLMMEIAIIGSDIQEVIGTSIAFYILSSKHIPIWGGVLITLADTFTFLLLERYGLRRLEMFFAFLIAVMAFTFGYEYVIADPDQLSVVKGTIIPSCDGCDTYTAWIQGVGIVGACIMPHNLYLHSSLVLDRQIDRSRKGEIREANFYNLLETGFSLFISFIINLFVISVFAKGLYNKTNYSVHELCKAQNITEADPSVFPANNETVTDMNIYRGGIYLACAYGSAAMYVWAVGILAAGQSSTMTGTYSGQVIMEGFLNLRWQRWKRVLFTRSMAILPTLFLAFFRGIKDLTDLNDDMNILMTIQLPFSLIPALTLSNSRYIMGEFANSRPSKAILDIISICIIAVNFYSFGEFVWSNLPHRSWVGLILALLILVYAVFIVYLVLFQFAMEGYDTTLTRLTLRPPSNLWYNIHEGKKFERYEPIASTSSGENVVTA